MRIRGLDRVFWAVTAFAVLLLVFSIVVGEWLGVHLIFVFGVLAGAVWLALHWFEKRLLERAGPEDEPIFCEWGSMIRRGVFNADEEMTRLSLESYGLDPASAVGQTFVCMTECGDDGQDYYFEGRFERGSDDSIVVRAIRPEQLSGGG